MMIVAYIIIQILERLSLSSKTVSMLPSPNYNSSTSLTDKVTIFMYTCFNLMLYTSPVVGKSNDPNMSLFTHCSIG